MKINGPNHVYECTPPFRNNRELPPEDQIVIGLKGFSMPEIDQDKLEPAKIRAMEHASTEEKVRLMEEKNLRKIASRVIFIKGLNIEGVGEVKDFETFYREAPLDLVDWVMHAPLSTEALICADRRTLEALKAKAQSKQETAGEIAAGAPEEATA